MRNSLLDGSTCRAAIVLLVVLSVALSGCGGSQSTQSNTHAAQTTSATSAPREIPITATPLPLSNLLSTIDGIIAAASNRPIESCASVSSTQGDVVMVVAAGHNRSKRPGRSGGESDGA